MADPSAIQDTGDHDVVEDVVGRNTDREDTVRQCTIDEPGVPMSGPLDVAALGLPAGPLDVAELVVRHHAELYRYAFRLTGSQADAEDLTQHAFLMAHVRGDQLREGECVRGWLYAIVRNTYLKQVRRRPPLLAGNIDLDIDKLPAAALDSPIDQERLQLALDELPEEFRIVVLMFYFEGLSYREIAQELKIPDGTVMSRLSRAKAHLRRQLSADRDE